MSNHYHIVVKCCPEQAEHWSNDEVIQRWLTLFKGPLLIQRYQQGTLLSPAEQETINDIVAVWRDRLTNLSWFMKCLNEWIAKQANSEDNCTGHFWEARYKSQALLSEEALLSCMAYVDLNPVRAAIADTPENSDHTSIRERINPRFNLKQAIKNTRKTQHPIKQFTLPIKPLLYFEETIQNKEQTGIPFNWKEYLSLVDWTGRAVRNDKRGAIASQLPPILQRLNADEDQWLTHSTQFEQQYRTINRRQLV